MKAKERLEVGLLLLAVVFLLCIPLTRCNADAPTGRPPGYWDTHAEVYSVEKALETFGDGLFISTVVMPDLRVNDISFIMEFTEGGSVENEEDWVIFNARVFYQKPHGNLFVTAYFEEAAYSQSKKGSAAFAEEITYHTIGEINVECHWEYAKSTFDDLYRSVTAFTVIDDRYFEITASTRSYSGLSRSEAEKCSEFLWDALEWLFMGEVDQ